MLPLARRHYLIPLTYEVCRLWHSLLTGVTSESSWGEKVVFHDRGEDSLSVYAHLARMTQSEHLCRGRHQGKM